MSEARADLYAHGRSAATWRKSSASGGAENNCAEITDLRRRRTRRTRLREPGREPLRFQADARAAFREGTFNAEL
ncbi:DUF397 domain-containing protein [Embleya sp. NPDC005575]|uniref:DUF397 domain-containing protein n=1 Tax=Embleya sp. NPDC005575 TaxID=3156892 RepID=UPI0033ADD72C